MSRYESKLGKRKFREITELVHPESEINAETEAQVGEELEVEPAAEITVAQSEAARMKQLLSDLMEDPEEESVVEIEASTEITPDIVAEATPEMVAESITETVAEIEGEPTPMGVSASEIDQANEANQTDEDQQTEFVETDQLVSIVESILFSSDKPVSVASIRQVFANTNVRTKDVLAALESIARDYASQRRGITLEEIHGGYQLRTKIDNIDFLKRMIKVRPFKLTGPSMEVMAIVAYKQPITKHEIDEIRGVESGHLLRALMEKGLVCFEGKSDLPGKPMYYGSTKKFLEIFGLRNIRELPTLSEIDELIPEGIGEQIDEASLADISESMASSISSTYSEGEEELLKINLELGEINTSSEFFEQEKERARLQRDHERAQEIRERLVLGEPVEDRDRKWLEKFEARLHNQDREQASGAPTIVSASEVADGPNIQKELENLNEFTDTDSRGAGAEPEIESAL